MEILRRLIERVIDLKGVNQVVRQVFLDLNEFKILFLVDAIVCVLPIFEKEISHPVLDENVVVNVAASSRLHL